MSSWFFLAITLCYPLLMEPITSQQKFYFLLLVFITTFLLPLISIAIFKLTGSISSLELPERGERFMPLLFVSLIYGLTLYLVFFKLSVNALVTGVFAGITLLLLLLTFISLKWQISLHSASAGGVAGYLVALLVRDPGSEALLYLASAFIILTGLIMSARLKLNAHSLEEVGAGSLLGFIICFFVLYTIP